MDQVSSKYRIIIVTSIIIIIGIVIWTTNQSQDEDTDLKLKITVTDEEYHIEIIGDTDYTINSIGYRILDPDGRIVTVKDQDDSWITYQGNLSDIRLDHYKRGNTINSLYVKHGYFYPDFPSWKFNQTMNIVYIQAPSDATHFGNGILLVKGRHNGGFADKGYRIILYRLSDNRSIVDVTLPPSQKPVQVDVSLVNGDYHVEVVYSDPLDINMIRFGIQTDDIYEHYNLSWIRFNLTIYRMALSSEFPNATYGDHFYAGHYDDKSRFPVLTRNLTLYFVYNDTNSNGYFDTGDWIYIRSTMNGGWIPPHFIFDLGLPKGSNGHLSRVWIRGVTPSVNITWNVSVINNTYAIQIHNITDISYYRVAIRFNNQTNEHKYLHLSFDINRTISNLYRIYYHQYAYDIAMNSSNGLSIYGERFYSYYHWNDTDDLRNETLYFIYEDTDDDQFLSNGDMIWIRPKDEGGLIEPGDRITLWNELLGEPYGTLKIPPLS